MFFDFPKKCKFLMHTKMRSISRNGELTNLFFTVFGQFLQPKKFCFQELILGRYRCLKGYVFFEASQDAWTFSRNVSILFTNEKFLLPMWGIETFPKRLAKNVFPRFKAQKHNATVSQSSSRSLKVPKCSKKLFENSPWEF